LAATLLGVVAGAIPGLRSSRAPVREVIERGSLGTPQRHRLRDAMALLQVALATVLMVGAALLVRSFSRLDHVDPGYDGAGVLSFDATLSTGRYPEPAEQAAVIAAVLERVRAVPGVESAGVTNALPLTGGPSTGVDTGGGADAPSTSADIRI